MQNLMKTAVRIATLAVILALGLFAFRYVRHSGQPAPGKDGGANIAEVVTVTVRPRRLPLTTELPGHTVPCQIAEIRPQISGLVLERRFTEGADIAAGETLYQIDPATSQAALNSALANLEAARRSVDRARAAVEVSAAAIVRQQAVVDLARINRERFDNLFKQRTVTASQHDQAVTEAAVAEATLTASKAQAGSDRVAVAAAEAGVRQAEAAVESVKINLGYTRITAPISGRIGKSGVTIGAIVTAYQPMAMAVIQQLDPIYVDVSQSTAELLRLQRRIKDRRLSTDDGTQAVSLILEDGAPYPREGVLQFRDVTVDPSTGTVTMRAVFPNPDGVLLPGAYVRAVIREGIADQALLVPQQAVSRNSKGEPTALVVNAEDKIEQRTLVCDRAIDDQWLVISGVRAGDRVVVEGKQKVRPGAAVRATSAPTVPTAVGESGGPASPAPQAN